MYYYILTLGNINNNNFLGMDSGGSYSASMEEADIVEDQEGNYIKQLIISN